MQCMPRIPCNSFVSCQLVWEDHCTVLTFCQIVQPSFSYLCHHTNRRNSTIDDNLGRHYPHTSECPYEHHSGSHFCRGGSLHCPRVEDLQRVWVEGIQIPWRRSSHQKNVCQLSNFPLPRQVRSLLLGRFLCAVSLVSPLELRLGILCYLGRFAVVRCPSYRGAPGGTPREQVDDGNIHVRVHRSISVLHLQG